MQTLLRSSAKERLLAAGAHLLVSAAIAVAVAALVFSVWYPAPLAELVGGRELFLLVVICDVILGPVITLIVFNRAKPRKELIRDLAIVFSMQMAALAYGMWSVYVARPLYLVFERDLFRVVRWVDIPEQKLSLVPDGMRPRLWAGPSKLSLREFTSDRERMSTSLIEIEGVPLSAMPEFWQRYELALPAIRSKGQALESFLVNFPAARASALESVAAASLQPGDVVVFPLVHQTHFWTVLLNKTTGEPIGFLPLDPYVPDAVHQ